MVKKTSGNKPPKAKKTQTEPSSSKMQKKTPSKATAPTATTKKFWTMDFMAERGFKSGNQSPAFVSTIEALGWEKFVQHGNSSIPPLVREFYASIPEPVEGHAPTYSIVRKVRVPFDAHTINEWYELGYHGTNFEKKVRNWGKAEMDDLKNRIAVENATWEKFGSELKIKKSFLIDEANMWFNFIKHSLLPTAQTTNVEKERLVLIEAIMQGENIDVGRLISREILLCKDKPMGNLFFPYLITELCIKAEVEIERKEDRRAPTGPFPTKFKVRQRPAAIASGDGSVLQHLRLQQQAIWRFIKEHYEWSSARFDELSKGKSTVAL